MKTKKVKLNKKAKRRLIIAAILAVCVLIASFAVYFTASVYSQIKDFDINNLTTTATSSQVSENGKTYYTYGSAQGKYTKYSEIPEVMVDAIVSAEDSRFFVHDGFDLPRIIKATISHITHIGVGGGGSTITQQLMKKTYYPQEKKTMQRKLGEAILSIQATQQTTKQKILELYLNKIYFGRGENTVGIYAASKYYFNKVPSQLTLPEAAYLAGSLNNPVYDDVYYVYQRSENRRNVILNLMRRHGYISDSLCEATKKVPLANTLQKNPVKQSKKYAAYVDRVTRELKSDWGIDPSKTNVTIYTYLDTEVQQYLDDIASGKNYSFPNRYMQTGGVVQESTTGRILGLLSGRDFKVGNYSYAFSDRHQPGSSIKPILDYATAFEYLYWSTGHMADDSTYSKGGWTPKNWDRKIHGDVTLYEALGKSWNLAAIHALNDVWKKTGKQKLIDYLKGLGFQMDKETFSLAYAIGGWSYGTTPLEMAGAYAAISNGGTYIKPHTIKKVVVNTTGETINVDERLKSDSKQAMADYAAFMLREIMTTYVKDEKDYSAFDIGYNIGAKTGTTNHDGKVPGIPRGKSKDNWLCGFSEDYSWAFWNGYTDSDQRKHGLYISGTNQSKLIAAKVANLLSKRKAKHSYETPSSVVQAKMVQGTYPYEAPRNSYTTYQNGKKVITAWFVKGHTPSGSSSNETSADTLSTLSSFSASVTDDNQIRVTFSSYDPRSMVTSGDVVYRVQVYEGSTLVHSQSLSSSSATLGFTPEANKTYRVVGFYSWSNGSGTSNKVSRTITTKKSSTEKTSYSVSSNGSRVSDGSTITGSSITVRTSGDSSNQVTIRLSGSGTASNTITAGRSTTFSGLQPGGSYTVTLTETTSDGSTKSLGSFSFKVQSNTTEETTED
jgi:penicillin-binding protein 1A